MWKVSLTVCKVSGLKAKYTKHLKMTKKDLFNYIDVLYSRKHRHASLGNVSPAVYEEVYEMKQYRAT